MDQSQEKLYTVSDLAALFDVSERTIYRWIADGSIRVLRQGRVTRVTGNALSEFIEKNSIYRRVNNDN